MACKGTVQDWGPCCAARVKPGWAMDSIPGNTARAWHVHSFSVELFCVCFSYSIFPGSIWSLTDSLCIKLLWGWRPERQGRVGVAPSGLLFCKVQISSATVLGSRSNQLGWMGWRWSAQITPAHCGCSVLHSRPALGCSLGSRLILAHQFLFIRTAMS